MSLRTIVNKYPGPSGVSIGLAVIVLLTLAIVFIPREAEIMLAIGAIGCIIVPLVIMMADHYKGMKSHSRQRISNKRSFVN